ncbi:energy transducer TonB [Prolixibacteraceae bacterium Z1-6]|uniref:Energy transducer TonB n=1 Tax=Draconibacterium aestuarii TaxID=2998507 RepID=A0A9X3FDH6_9BACT|nr:energy transducer TonB [Prolixibacteraceae bacterium Z1-6]
MKTIVVLILCMVAALLTFGQDNQMPVQSNVEEVKVTPPRFAGEIYVVQTLKEEKIESIDDYLVRNISYPEKERKLFIQGTEVVQFTVSPTGKLSDFIIINSVSPNMDEEVIRVLQTTNGMWMPGHNNDQPVTMESEVSVAFKIDGMRFPPDFNELGTKYFSKGGKLFLTRNNPKKSLKYYNKAAQYVPNDVNLLLLRGMARYETGNTLGAICDWERIKALGDSVADVYLSKVRGYEGYEELASILNK